MSISLTRVAGFRARHRYYRPEWSESRNREVFGLPAFAYGKTLPTCEAIAAYVFPRISAQLPAGLVLERVRVMEDPTLYADCTGVA